MTRDAAKVITIVICFAGLAPAVTKADGGGDGLYERWDRSLSLSVGAGGGATWLTNDTHGSAVGELRLLFADAAGPVVAGRWAPDGGQHVFVGLDVRPLFPALFFILSATWNEFWDLVIQSIHVELGAAFLIDGERSVAFSYGFGLGVPVARPKAALRDIWLHLGARRVNANPSFRQTQNGIDLSEWTAYATLVFTFGIPMRLGGWEPPRYRHR